MKSILKYSILALTAIMLMSCGHKKAGKEELIAAQDSLITLLGKKETVKMLFDTYNQLNDKSTFQMVIKNKLFLKIKEWDLGINTPRTLDSLVNIYKEDSQVKANTSKYQYAVEILKKDINREAYISYLREMSEWINSQEGTREILISFSASTDISLPIAIKGQEILNKYGLTKQMIQEVNDPTDNEVSLAQNEMQNSIKTVYVKCNFLVGN